MLPQFKAKRSADNLRGALQLVCCYLISGGH
jgi:hypothetical protein